MYCTGADGGEDKINFLLGALKNQCLKETLKLIFFNHDLYTDSSERVYPVRQDACVVLDKARVISSMIFSKVFHFTFFTPYRPVPFKLVP